ncbi:MAG: hypothetical protein FJ014_01685 [Chloroflexi bacterium]|nr:hypothetical protein [Chloroflexota bacterium]
MAKKPLFPGQLDDENVIIYERRYWFTILEWIRLPFLFLLISSVVAWVVTTLLGPTSVLSLVFYGLVIMAIAWLVWQALNWENDRYIVTDKRVIHIEKVFLTLEKRDEAPLTMIQDVFVEMKGLMTHLLYFGNVTIHTAGTLGTIRFQGIRKPRKAQAQILALASQVQAAIPMEETPGVQAVREILGWPKPEPKPLPPTAEELHWESEKRRREQLSEVIKMMFFPKPVFGENQIIWRKHWWVLLNEMASPLLVFVILLILWAAVSLRFGVNFRFDLLFGISLVAISLWITWLVTDWWNDLYVITDDRAIDIEKMPFVREERREADLDKIQDVRYLQEGFIALRLDFGNVRLETAGGIEAFTFDSVPHPREVQIEIFRRIDRFHREIERQLQEARQYEFLDLLGRYHQRVQGNSGTEP